MSEATRYVLKHAENQLLDSNGNSVVRSNRPKIPAANMSQSSRALEVKPRRMIEENRERSPIIHYLDNDPGKIFDNHLL